MLTVTPAAAECLLKMLKLQDGPEDAAVRIVFDDDELTLRLDCQRDGDHAYMHDDRPVLLIDADTSEMLTDDTLDFEDDALMLSHPADES